MNPKIINAININQYRKSNAVYPSRRSKVHIAPTNIITIEIPSLFKSVRKIFPQSGHSRFFLKFQNVTSKPSNSFPQPGQFLSSEFFINHNGTCRAELISLSSLPKNIMNGLTLSQLDLDYNFPFPARGKLINTSGNSIKPSVNISI